MSGQHYNGEERREQPLPTALVAYMDHLQHTIMESFKATEAKLEKRIDERFDALEDKFMAAFPDKDPYGHCRAHQSQIQTAETWKDIGRAVGKKLAEGVAWGFVLLILYLIKNWWEGHWK